jgi:hypothetical protein
VFGPSQFLTVSSKSFLKNMKKNKKVCNHSDMGIRGERIGEFQMVDVTNKGMVNRYLMVFHHVLHFMVYNRTSSSTYMSD